MASPTKCSKCERALAIFEVMARDRRSGSVSAVQLCETCAWGPVAMTLGLRVNDRRQDEKERASFDSIMLSIRNAFRSESDSDVDIDGLWGTGGEA